MLISVYIYFLSFFICFLSKKLCFYQFHSFFNGASNFHNRILTNQKVIRNCQWNFMHKINVTHFVLISSLVLCKIPKFHLISWCGNFVERLSFRRVSGESPKTLRKLCLSTKFPHQLIRWNFGILCSVTWMLSNNLQQKE